MTRHDAWTILTVDERRFLRELFAESRRRGDDTTTEERVVIEADSGQSGFVQRLLASGRLRLIVDGDGETLQYSLDVDPDSLASRELKLRARYPVLVDRRGRARSLRVRPGNGEVRVRDHGGRLQQADVVDISTSGVFLQGEEAKEVSSGASLSGLHLQLPNHDGVRVGGRVVRVRRSGDRVGVAMAFDRRDMDRDSRSALREYVFERYQQRSA
ncbi:PilZ domain-containing protein [Aquisalimonas asiatica]|uniref:PilZ domain-containing protein n=1 Tax=Aquisalimonas asiatica TaxID=406100 RepID=A0A1H8V2Q7_9GAMM|nr:PilZ domain-containing protein [Aquisalimonas asiatica]SEP09681.1 PilZ domain-containing protein [Aquisalimonas asiatica]